MINGLNMSISMTLNQFRHAVIIMEYVGSRNLQKILIELKDKTLGKFIKYYLMCYSIC